MTQYQRILMTVDFIPEDDAPVAKRALEIAAASGGNIYLLHVMEENYYHPGLYITKNNIEEYEKNLENSARECLVEIGHNLSVPHERLILSMGKPKNVILSTADKIEADLIIVGSHGRHGLGLFLMGSTANDILHRAKCDVLAVRVTPAPRSETKRMIFAESNAQ